MAARANHKFRSAEATARPAPEFAVGAEQHDDADRDADVSVVEDESTEVRLHRCELLTIFF